MGEGQFEMFQASPSHTVPMLKGENALVRNNRISEFVFLQRNSRHRGTIEHHEIVVVTGQSFTGRFVLGAKILCMNECGFLPKGSIGTKHSCHGIVVRH